MKFLCIGDLHIKVDNLSIIDLLESRLCEFLKHSDVEAIVVLGDVLHTHEKIHTAPLNRAKNLFGRLAEFGKPIFILVGNHDYIQNDQFLTDNHWMNVLKNWNKVHVIDRVVFYKDVCLLPYVPRGRFVEALETGDKPWAEARVIFCHQEFEGAAMNNGIVSVLGDKWDAEWPLIISGHIHSRQDLACGVHYVGCALPGNDGKVSVSVFCSDTKEIEEVKFVFPKRKKITCSVDELDEKHVGDVSVILIIDNYEKYKIFQKSSVYQNLVADGVAINFKPADICSDPVAEAPVDYSFDDLLLSEVLSARNEFLYCAYEKIIHETELEEEDILFI